MLKMGHAFFVTASTWRTFPRPLIPSRRQHSALGQSGAVAVLATHRLSGACVLLLSPFWSPETSWRKVQLLGDNQGRASQLCPAIPPSPLEVQTHE